MATLTLGWLSLFNASAEQVIEAAGTAGFRSVSIRLTGRKLGDDFPEIVGSAQAMAGLKSRLTTHGLSLSNTSTYHLSPDITLDTLEPVLDATAELGCPMVVANCMDPDHERWVEFAARYCEAAARRKLRVALEFVPFSQCRTVATAVKLVAATGMANFGILADSLHLSRSGGSPADLAAVDPERFFFAQICDAVAQRPPDDGLANEARTGRLYPGEGALPLDSFLKALPPEIEIECETPIAAHAGMDPSAQAKTTLAAALAFLDRHFAAADTANPYR